MKNLLFAIITFFAAQNLSAKIPIPIGTSEHLKVIHDLPNTDDYKRENGKYLDLGILYETFDVAWMPMWVSTDPIIVGLEGNDADLYYDIDPALKKELITEFKLKEEELTQLSFFDKHLGLLVVGGVIILYVLFNMMTSKKEDEENDVEKIS